MEGLRDLLGRLAAAVQYLAEQWGAPGLAAVAFVDSSFLTLPQATDILVVVATIEHPDRWWLYGLTAMAGSLAGCFALYSVARSGAHALLRRGIHERHLDRGMAWFQRYGAPVLIVPSMLPPPMPFKIFVVMAGMSDLRPLPFITAIAIGRTLRYGGEAWLARTYGETAIIYLQRNALDLLWPVLGLSVLAASIWWVWTRRRRGRQT